MARRQKPTRRMRVRLDITVDFDHELPTLPMGGPEDVEAFSKAIEPVLRGLKGAIGGCINAAEFNLDRRQPKGGK